MPSTESCLTMSPSGGAKTLSPERSPWPPDASPKASRTIWSWGYAKDYVECMWLMLQQDKPEDFVIATGIQHTVRDFAHRAFKINGIDINWEGEGLQEKGYDARTGKMLVCVNPAYFRPTDVDNLWGDPTKARTVLGWNPQKTSYDELVAIMAKHDRELAKQEGMRRL